MKLMSAVALTSLALSMSFTTYAAGDAGAGKAKSAMCVACHGAEGKSANDLWPNLAGQKAGYLSKQLKDFKSGARKDPVMSGMAMPLSDQDIANLAAYYSSLK